MIARSRARLPVGEKVTSRDSVAVEASKNELCSIEASKKMQ